MKTGFILVVIQVLAGQPATDHQAVFETKKECVLAGTRWLEENTEILDETAKSERSLWYYCQEVDGVIF